MTPTPASTNLHSFQRCAHPSTMSKIASESVSAEAAAQGDIVSMYPHLVGPFAVFQIIGWAFSLLEVAGSVGPIGFTIMESTYPVDIAFCQLMFWGTLHFGPISDGRLSMLCRLAFCIEAIVFVTSCLAVFRPNAVADAIGNGNTTTVFGMEFDDLPKMFLGYIQAAWWFVVFVPFAAWIGTTALMVGRRRLVQRLPHSELATFSSRFMRWYVLIFALQAGIGIWAMVNTATARTAEDAVLTKKINYALRAVSLFFSMTPGLHAIIFTAAGVSHQTFKSGKAPVATYVAAALVVAYIAVVAFDVAIVFSAQTSTDAILGVHGVIELFGLENVPMMGVWLCAAYQFGLKFGHLRNFDKTEERLDAKRQAGAKGGAEGEASAGYDA